MEIAVKPGRVFSSLTRTRSVPRSRKKSTRAMPEIPAARKAFTASARTSSETASRDRRGDQELRVVLAVLVVVVVELAARNDFSDDRGKGIVVAEDGALQLPRVDALLDEDAVVVAEGDIKSRIEVGPVLDFGDAYGRAAVGGFDEEGKRKRGAAGGESRPRPCRPLASRGATFGRGRRDILSARETLALPKRGETPRAPPLPGTQHEEARGGNARVAQEGLEDRLVHADGGAGDAGAHVGDPEELEEALEDAVLAGGAVNDRDDDVGARRTDLRRHESLLGRRRRGGLGQAELLGNRARGEQPARLCRRKEAPVRADRQRDNLVARRVERPGDRARGDARDLSLDGTATEEDDDLQAAHSVTS